MGQYQRSEEKHVNRPVEIDYARELASRQSVEEVATIAEQYYGIPKEDARAAIKALLESQAKAS